MHPDFTTVVAVDERHLREFSLSYQTWERNCRPILQNPLLILADGTECRGWWESKFAKFMQHPNCKVVAVPLIPGSTQRHRMLSALIHGPAEHVDTEWYLKLDTDTWCMTPVDDWAPDEWFDSGYVAVSHRWNYTKPASMYRDLLLWAETHEPVEFTAPAPKTTYSGDDVEEAKRKAFHRRIISFAMWARTDFTQDVSRISGTQFLLPIPSQDTFYWYCAARMGKRVGRANMKDRGWKHTSRKIEQIYAEAMGQ